jgi:hypothetical protein
MQSTKSDDHADWKVSFVPEKTCPAKATDHRDEPHVETRIRPMNGDFICCNSPGGSRSLKFNHQAHQVESGAPPRLSDHVYGMEIDDIFPRSARLTVINPRVVCSLSLVSNL